MANESEPPFTLAELTELQELELSARGETRDDVIRSLRLRLGELRAGKGKGSGNGIHIGRSPHLSMESRIAALEAEVARLRALIEGGRNNG
jgi:hypothetical protein